MYRKGQMFRFRLYRLVNPFVHTYITGREFWIGKESLGQEYIYIETIPPFSSVVFFLSSVFFCIFSTLCLFTQCSFYPTFYLFILHILFFSTVSIFRCIFYTIVFTLNFFRIVLLLRCIFYPSIFHPVCPSSILFNIVFLLACIVFTILFFCHIVFISPPPLLPGYIVFTLYSFHPVAPHSSTPFHTIFL